MPKVKKRPGVTGARSTSRASVRKSAPPAKKRLAKKPAKAPAPRPPAAEFHVRELDPQAKCGPGTSVQFLHRVVERADGTVTNHMVFFDQHGWYCEHGRTCPAVGHAKKFLGWTARD